MAIAFPTTLPDLIGPGARIFVTGVAGPVPVDDYLLMNLNRVSDNQGFTYGILLGPVAGTNLVTLGYDGRLKRIASGAGGGMAQGTPMQLELTQYHANGTVVDHAGPTACGDLDLLSFPWTLARFAGQDGDTSLGAILAAVQTTFPSSS